MANESVHITINPDGSLQVEAIGYQGEMCLKDLEKLISDLKQSGIDVQDKTTKMKAAKYATHTTTARRVGFDK